MKTLATILRRTTKPVRWDVGPSSELVRTFVETGDERCPLAGIWMRLTDSNSPVEDPELPWPAVADSFWRRAFHLGFTILQYSTPKLSPL